MMVTSPLVAQTQQRSTPVVGFLSQGTPETAAAWVAAVRQGLGETGLVEAKDFTSEFRWANNDPDLLPGLAADLIQRRVAIIVNVGNVGATRAAKAATTEIPIVFAAGVDPVSAGLVPSLNHPGGNVTGITTMNFDIAPKQVGLLRELLPAARRIGTLVNINNPEGARSIITGAQDGAIASGVQNLIFFASNDHDIDAAFAGLGGRIQALIMGPDVFFTQNLRKLAALAIREKLPTTYALPDFPKAGGLMSYGSSFTDAHRQAGVYAGRILKGEKPGDLPIQRATKFELLLNLSTAKSIGLDIHPMLLARADEVIE
jgi:putative ABC transport system substrate-binding protein